MNVIITGEWKTGRKGTVMMTSIDNESRREYAYIELEGTNRTEVFFEDEYQKQSE